MNEELEARIITLTDYEKKEPEWWCNHHKISMQWLIVQMARYFEDPSEGSESVIKAALPRFANSIQFDLAAEMARRGA